MPPSIANYIIKQWLALLQQQNIDAQPALSAAGILPQQLADIDGRITLPQHFAFMQAATELSGDPCFALQVGSMAQPQHMGVLGRVLMHSATLYQAGLQAVRYSQLMAEGFDIQLQQQADEVNLQLVKALPQYDSVAATEEMLAAFVAAMRGLSQRQLPLKRIHFRHSKPAYHQRYEAFFRCPICYQQALDEVCIDNKMLDYAVDNADEYVLDLSQKRADALLQDLGDEALFRRKVSGIVMQHLASAKVDVAYVAQQLAMSRWTLNRKLKQEGVSFTQLLQQLRFELAKNYLAGNESIYQIAFLLGYAEPSAFNHAFKQWSGTSPRSYRRQLNA